MISRGWVLVGVLASAAALADDSKWSYGATLKAGSYSVEDGDGSTNAKTAYVPGLKLVYDLEGRGRRVFAGIDFLNFDLDGSTSAIGQDVSGYSLTAGYEQRFNLARYVKLWLGAGLSANSVDFTNRYKVADDGFLGATYPDHSENYLGGIVTASTEFDLLESDNWKFGVGGFALMPFGDGVKGAGLLLSVTYNK